MYSYEIERSPSYLEHHGIKGQKWGVRRYQNEDGSWTAAGRSRYAEGDGKPRNFSDDSNVKGARIKAAGHNTLAKIHSINENYYRKRGNTLYAGMNKAAKTQEAKRAQELTDIANKQKQVRIERKQAQKKERADTKQKLKDTQKQIDSEATRKDKFIYNEATRKKAAKLIVKNNIPKDEAIKKAKNAAWRNTAIMAVASAAYITVVAKKF